MIIAHLSDMHVGSQFQPDVFDVLLEEINSIKPDAVVITGDLTNQGLVKEFEECKRLISRFKTKKLITMSGNHDYRNTGYLLFKKYFPFDHVNEIGKDVVIVTVGTSRPDRNDGEIGYLAPTILKSTLNFLSSMLLQCTMNLQTSPDALRGGSSSVYYGQSSKLP